MYKANKTTLMNELSSLAKDVELDESLQKKFNDVLNSMIFTSTESEDVILDLATRNLTNLFNLKPLKKEEKDYKKEELFKNFILYINKQVKLKNKDNLLNAIELFKNYANSYNKELDKKNKAFYEFKTFVLAKKPYVSRDNYTNLFNR